MEPLRFAPPEDALLRLRVFPVFIPYQGCPSRCVFCAQDLQTGTPQRPLHVVLRELRAQLTAMLHSGALPVELAFYGGTFTCLSPEEQMAALDMAAFFRAKGLITRVRASTRPDAFTPDDLARLHEGGLHMLELGVQSFDDAALTASRRSYTGDTAFAACHAVRNAGLELGIQLLPGMPGVSPAVFAADMARVVQAAPKVLRLYPSLVLAGTEMEAMFRAGTYAPWSFEETVPVLADAVLKAWDNHIRVIRIGLAPEEALDRGGIIAGPRHPSLGSMVRGLALFRYVTRHIPANATVTRLLLPRRLQGEFWGHEASLVDAYAPYGLTRDTVQWHDEEYCELR